MSELFSIDGRGAQSNPVNRFDKHITEWSPLIYEDPSNPTIKTRYINVRAKTIINKVESPDIQFDYSLNPYQGCEHGCVYCYARVTHNYWGYSAGLDFESIITIKSNAPQLLEQKLKSKKWKASAIMMSGNTDCYQPIERKLQITRKLLQIFWRYRHPVAIVTKNKLLLRDLDILKKLNQYQLVKVAVSINSLDDSIRRKLEPRASTIKSRLELIETLANENIPVKALAAPIIPGLNDYEILPLVKELASRGVFDINHIILRLNGDVEQIFEEWANKIMPDKKQKIMNMVASCHGGQVNDHRFRTRMKGEGKISEIIADQFAMAKNKYLPEKGTQAFNLDLHAHFKDPQLDLFRSF
jgi:DNA repair photolyase